MHSFYQLPPADTSEKLHFDVQLEIAFSKKEMNRAVLLEHHEIFPEDSFTEIRVPLIDIASIKMSAEM